MVSSTKKKQGVEGNGMMREALVQAVQTLWDEHVSKSPPTNTVDQLDEHLKLRSALVYIQNIHSQLSKTDSLICGENQRSKGSIDRFVQWCKDHGVEVKNLRLTKFPQELGLGLVANKKINEGEIVVEVPRKAMLSLDQARRSPFLKKAFERDLLLQQMDNVGLAISVCCQRLAGDSMWKPYLDVLPSTFSCPVYYTVEQLKELKPSPLFEEALLLFRNVVRQFAYFLLQIAKNDEFDKNKKNSVAPPIFYNTPLSVDTFTFSLYRWAMCCVSTRINMIPSDQLKLSNGQPKMIPALIPMLDMANHRSITNFNQESVVFCGETDFAQIVTPANLEPTEQLFIFYGRRTNSDFLLYNGFIPDENQKNYDAYRLKLGINKNEKHYNARVDRFVQLGFSGAAQSNIFVFDLRTGSQSFDEKLLEFVQILIAEEPTDECINSEGTIVKAKKWLETRLKLLLKAYEKLGDEKKNEDDGIKTAIRRLHEGEKALLESALAKLTA
ncbi:unnamed protein product, partial [Mesorhabditis belari]|uniref:protein-histidine N-methyltransferase n=1 Tax=Mesorhabditis belari TaxID=2138241 RepID=A0AAF3EAM9_9BILA